MWMDGLPFWQIVVIWLVRSLSVCPICPENIVTFLFAYLIVLISLRSNKLISPRDGPRGSLQMLRSGEFSSALFIVDARVPPRRPFIKTFISVKSSWYSNINIASNVKWRHEEHWMRRRKWELPTGRKNT